MTGTVLFDLVDVLFDVINALPECAPPVKVFDGLATTDLPPRFVLVGATADGERPLPGDQQWAALGARRRNEDLEVPVTVSVAVGGSNDPGGTNAQKAARAAVKTIVHAIEGALRADVTLMNGSNTPLVLWAEVASVSLRQADRESATAGRGATVDLVIRAHTRI